MRSCSHWEQSSFCWCGWAAPSQCSGGVALLGQQTDKQAFQCLLRSTGILLLADYTYPLQGERG